VINNNNNKKNKFYLDQIPS